MSTMLALLESLNHLFQDRHSIRSLDSNPNYTAIRLEGVIEEKLPIASVHLPDLVTSNGQFSRITEAGVALFYPLDHSGGQLFRSLSAFCSADPYHGMPVAACISGNITAHKINVRAVEFVDLAQGFGAFGDADKLKRAQMTGRGRFFCRSQNVPPEAVPDGGYQSGNKYQLKDEETSVFVLGFGLHSPCPTYCFALFSIFTTISSRAFQAARCC